jgi:hypothetical protein
VQPRRIREFLPQRDQPSKILKQSTERAKQPRQRTPHENFKHELHYVSEESEEYYKRIVGGQYQQTFI